MTKKTTKNDVVLCLLYLFMVQCVLCTFLLSNGLIYNTFHLFTNLYSAILTDLYSAIFTYL
jgi:hypothetical protein